jgi:hypothetical protein
VDGTDLHTCLNVTYEMSHVNSAVCMQCSRQVTLAPRMRLQQAFSQGNRQALSLCCIRPVGRCEFALMFTSLPTDDTHEAVRLCLPPPHAALHGDHSLKILSR